MPGSLKEIAQHLQVETAKKNKGKLSVIRRDKRIRLGGRSPKREDQKPRKKK